MISDLCIGSGGHFKSASATVTATVDSSFHSNDIFSMHNTFLSGSPRSTTFIGEDSVKQTVSTFQSPRKLKRKFANRARSEESVISSQCSLTSVSAGLFDLDIEPMDEGDSDKRQKFEVEEIQKVKLTAVEASNSKPETLSRCPSEHTANTILALSTNVSSSKQVQNFEDIFPPDSCDAASASNDTSVSQEAEDDSPEHFEIIDAPTDDDYSHNCDLNCTRTTKNEGNKNFRENDRPVAISTLNQRIKIHKFDVTTTVAPESSTRSDADNMNSLDNCNNNNNSSWLIGSDISTLLTGQRVHFKLCGLYDTDQVLGMGDDYRNAADLSVKAVVAHKTEDFIILRLSRVLGAVHVKLSYAQCDRCVSVIVDKSSGVLSSRMLSYISSRIDATTTRLFTVIAKLIQQSKRVVPWGRGRGAV